MADSDVQSVAAPAEVQVQETVPSPAERVYPISRDGRRQALVLLVGVATIWVFALWSLITIMDAGITGVEWVSAVLMLGLLLVAPVVAWALLEEANSRITLTSSGITYRTLAGIETAYTWEQVEGFERNGKRSRMARFLLGNEEEEEPEGAVIARDGEDDDDEEPKTLLLRVRGDSSTGISNPAVRFLHKTAHGDGVPIYAGIENRGELLSAIRERAGQS